VQLRIGIEKCLETRHEHQPREGRIDVDAQPAAHGSRPLSRRAGGFLQAAQERNDFLAEVFAALRKPHRPGVSIQQSRAKMLLQPLNSPAHGGLRKPEDLAGLAKRTGFNHRRDDRDLAQESRVEAHSYAYSA